MGKQQNGEININMVWVKAHEAPPKIVVTSIIFLELIFWVMYGHHILDYFFF